MNLRQIILNFLYEHIEGFSFTHIEGFSFMAIYNHWRQHEPEVDRFSDAIGRRLGRLLGMMAEHGEIECLKFSQYRLTTSKWLSMTASRQSCSKSSTTSQLAVTGTSSTR